MRGDCLDVLKRAAIELIRRHDERYRVRFRYDQQSSLCRQR